MRKTSPTRRSSRPVAHVRPASRKIWLAGLGTFALARNVIVGVVEPNYRALVAEGQNVEQRLIRITGDAIERAVAIGQSAWKVAADFVEQSRDSGLQAIGLGGAKRARKRNPVGRLARRVEAMESEVRHAAQPR